MVSAQQCVGGSFCLPVINPGKKVGRSILSCLMLGQLVRVRIARGDVRAGTCGIVFGIKTVSRLWVSPGCHSLQRAGFNVTLHEPVEENDARITGPEAAEEHMLLTGFRGEVAVIENESRSLVGQILTLRGYVSASRVDSIVDPAVA